MINIDLILEGWENYLDKSEVVEAMAEFRADICSECPSAKKGTLLVFLKDNLKQIEGYKCTECKCPLSAKVRSNDKCPLGKW